MHEGALVCGLSVLSQWCTHFSNQVPKVLVDAFKVRLENHLYFRSPIFVFLIMPYEHFNFDGSKINVVIDIVV